LVFEDIIEACDFLKKNGGNMIPPKLHVAHKAGLRLQLAFAVEQPDSQINTSNPVYGPGAMILRDQATLCFCPFLQQRAMIHGFAKIAIKAIANIAGKMTRQ
jgi:hypothetical protein